MSARPRASPKRRPMRESHVIGDRPPAGETTRRSFFPECPHELILQGLDQVGHHGALAGLHESLDWHAWNELDIAEPGNFTFRHADASGVVILPGALIGCGVGGNPRNRAVDFRSCALIEG